MGETGIGNEETVLFIQPDVTDSTSEIAMEAPTWAFGTGTKKAPLEILTR